MAVNLNSVTVRSLVLRLTPLWIDEHGGPEAFIRERPEAAAKNEIEIRYLNGYAKESSDRDYFVSPRFQEYLVRNAEAKARVSQQERDLGAGFATDSELAAEIEGGRQAWLERRDAEADARTRDGWQSGKGIGGFLLQPGGVGPTGTTVALLGAALAGYHGYTRNSGDLVWGLIWGALGATAPTFVVPTAFYQGYAKPTGTRILNRKRKG